MNDIYPYFNGNYSFILIDKSFQLFTAEFTLSINKKYIPNLHSVGAKRLHCAIFLTSHPYISLSLVTKLPF